MSQPGRSSLPLQGRVAIVTGAGQGIGRAEAKHLASLGARVIVNDLGTAPDGSGTDPSLAQVCVGEIEAEGGTAFAHAGDISEPEGAASLLDLALGCWGKVDIVVNNAGNIRDRMLFTMTTEDWDSVVKVHLRGHFLMTRLACAHWRERSKQGDSVRGRVINTTSTSGLVGSAGQANYGAAKAGVAALTQIASLEMARYGVTVNAVAPGARTRMTERVFAKPAVAADAPDPLGPEHVARVVGFLASDAADHVTGQVIRVKGSTIELYQGWRPVATTSRHGGWTSDGVVQAMEELFRSQPSRYTPAYLPGQLEDGSPGAGETASGE
ncbi:MAG TPA: SDR family NAD(P)-dependent oxidoreductase [Candidatus Dormibacteraeota bacterium]